MSNLDDLVPANERPERPACIRMLGRAAYDHEKAWSTEAYWAMDAAFVAAVRDAGHAQ